MNFLTEHKIEQYAELTAKITEATKANEQAADSLKEVEKRLTDMTPVSYTHLDVYKRQSQNALVFKVFLI